MRLRTNSKVNLFLKVLGTRTDGYHEVETILHTVGLADDIEVVPTKSGELEMEMRFDAGLSGILPSTEENFAYHAGSMLLEAGARNEGVLMRILKRIPLASGLGGGSGNAAGALVALHRHWGLAIDPSDLLRLAEKLGSDVPYCIQGGTALASGRGEKLTHLTQSISGWFVLGISNDPLTSRVVYEEWDEERNTTDQSPAAMTLALGAGDLDEVASLLHNDLEAAAFRLRPELPDKKQALLEAGSHGALVSGSGPTLFGLCASEEEARAVAGKVGPLFDRIEIVPSRAACVEVETESVP